MLNHSDVVHWVIITSIIRILKHQSPGTVMIVVGVKWGSCCDVYVPILIRCHGFGWITASSWWNSAKLHVPGVRWIVHSVLYPSHSTPGSGLSTSSLSAVTRFQRRLYGYTAGTSRQVPCTKELFWRCLWTRSNVLGLRDFLYFSFFEINFIMDMRSSFWLQGRD